MKRLHAFLASVAVGVTAALAAAQAASPATRPASAPAGQEVVRYAVPPAGEPRPALKVSLLPDPIDLEPRNAVTSYYLAVQLMPAQEQPKDADQVVQWLALPPKDLPAEAVRAMLSKYDRCMHYASIAARSDRCDWDLPIKEGFNLIMPDFARFRGVVRVLALDARLAVAQGRHDHALARIQTGLAMSRHLSDGTLLIGSLVGVACSTVMLDQARELSAAGGPNLYWALAHLPQPLVDLQRGLASERAWIYHHQPGLRGLTTATLTGEQWNQRFQDLVGLYALVEGGEPALGQPAMASLLATKLYPEGKKYLIAQGRSPQDVEAMPVGQVVTLFLLEQYEYWRDETFKWFALPYRQARSGMEATLKRFDAWRADPANRLNPAAILLPALNRAVAVQSRLGQRLAMLQVVEAVRAHAAANEGLPPASLEALALPVPINLWTGKPFDYRAEARTFVVDAPAQPGQPAADGLRFEVTLEKAK